MSLINKGGRPRKLPPKEPTKELPPQGGQGDLCGECKSLINNFHWSWCSHNAVKRELIAPDTSQAARNPSGRPRKYGAWA